MHIMHSGHNVCYDLKYTLTEDSAVTQLAFKSKHEIEVIVT